MAAVQSVPIAHLFLGTVPADHPGGEFHGVVLILVVAHVTGVGPSAAGEPNNIGAKPSPPSAGIKYQAREMMGRYLSQRWLCLKCLHAPLSGSGFPFCTAGSLMVL